MSRTYADPDFEPRVADWLEADPDLAPPEVLATVSAAFPSIPQRRASRLPRRFQTMNRFALLGAAAAIVAVVGLGGLALSGRGSLQSTGVSPTASPSPLATPTSSAASTLTATFNSPLYNYTMHYGPTWTVTPATITAEGHPDAGDETDDRFQPTGTDTTVSVVASPLVGNSWQADLDAVEQDLQNDTAISENCRPSQPWPAVTVGGREGVRIIKCNQEVVLVHVDDQEYMFLLAHETFDTSRHLYGAAFDAMLASVTFVPAPASSATVLTKSYNSGQHGYAIGYPDGWTVKPATATWLAGSVTNWGSLALDVIASADTRLVAASQPLAAGQSPEAWYQAYCAAGQEVTDACRNYATTWTPIAVGPETGYINLDGAPALQGSIKPGAPVFDAVVVVDGRGYEFTLDGAGDRALFEQLLGSVTFTTATGSPLDHVGSTFTSPLYDYSIAVDPAWTTTPATEAINSPTSTDDNCCDQIAVTDTDTTVRVSADPLDGRSIDAYLQDAHKGVLDDPMTPAECKGGDPSTWLPVEVGTSRGVLMTLCNFAVVYVNVGDRMYAFEWGHDTFEGSRHLALADFEQLLTTVSFAGS